MLETFGAKKNLRVIYMFTMFTGDAYKQHLCFRSWNSFQPLSQVEAVKRPPSWVVFVDVFPQLFGEDHPQLDLQIG